ncbi:hypothetical protein QFC20_001630 [Naganishia adeliensis]|uniref:Uncharacterized protein n=1 Tax=Naganishia adeliensis TaxID=92952 RepID=A0ACC2WQS3_9TREE|nr:hypothetical protein QFC20_001630 [Naganishia adeliensis]
MDLPAPEPTVSSPNDITLASAAAEIRSPTAIVIDPALRGPVPNPVIRTSHPLSAAPVPVIITKPSNSRPVPTNPLNGLSRSSSAALTSRSPSATGPRPVIPSPYHHVNRPATPKKPSRDFTPARLTDKRRPMARRTGARGLSADPYQPPTASSLGYQPARNSNTVDDTNLAAGLSPDTLSVLEAAATTLSQIQGPITQEHLEGIVLQLTNAGIDLAQLGLGGLLAQEEEEDTTQDPNRMDVDMDSSSMTSAFAAQGFGDAHADSQPDDMNLQAQSLIAALSALVPQSQAPAELVPPNQGEDDTRDAPITIDLTDEPDDEAVSVPEPKVAELTSELVPTADQVPQASPAAVQEGTTSGAVSPKTGDLPISDILEDLEQEKERISKLDRQARIEVLEKLILDLGDESTVAIEAEKDQPGSPKDQDLSEQRNGKYHAMTQEQKGKAARLELYRTLLSSAKTESPLDPALTSSPAKKDDLAIDVPNAISPSMQEAEAVSASLDTSALWAEETENPASKIDDLNGGGTTNNINGIATDAANDGTATATASPQSTLNQQNGDKVQTNEKEEEPIVVKAEPVEMDFTAFAATETSTTMLEQQAGEAANPFSGDATSHAHQEQEHVQPADVSMEEDPLLAELFPTFPTGDSPMQANQMQIEEEADPLLAGMLQELDASNGHDNIGYDGDNQDNFTAGWNPWAEVPHVLPETIVQVASAFEMDHDPHKMNLGLIGFREDSGRIFVPPTTRQTERQLYGRGGPQHDALPIEGFGPFLQAGVRMAYGSDSKPYREARIAVIQAVSVTGALRLGGTFLARFPLHLGTKSVFVPNPTTGEDARALHEAGLDVKLYRFFDRANGGVDFPGMCEDLAQAPEQSIVLLHVSGSSPTGTSLVISQWRTLIDIIKAGRHVPLLVMEFQGLASGDPNIDAHPVRYMTQEGIPFMLVQSFDSAMGLYIDSPSIVSVVTNSHEEKLRIESQLRHVARALHSHPGPLGAHIAAGILNDSQMYRSWLKEIKAMSDRLRSIREKLYDYLTHKLRTPGVWDHFRGSRGITVLLDPIQIRTLATREHIHLLPDGCFSLGCLNAAKIELLARAIDRVVRNPDIVMTGEDDAYLGAMGDEETTLTLEMALQESFPGYE